MNFASIISKVTTITKGTSGAAAKVLFKLKKAAPAIAIVGGTAGTAVAGVWAVKKTITEAPEVLDEIKHDIDEVKSKDLGTGALFGVYMKGGVKVISTYAGPILMEAGSAFSILYAFKIINGRFVAMSATAAALEEANRRLKASAINYRASLAERYGEDFDKDITFDQGFCLVRHDGALEFPVKTTIDENGNEVKEEGMWEIKREGSPFDTLSPYAVIFDEMSSEWSKDPSYNKLTLHRIQITCNDMLHARGHLFLNDVYKELGLPETQVGQLVGWISKGDGDGYVDFGIYDLNAVDNRREFINGYEPSIILDFNVDGVIWDKI